MCHYCQIPSAEKKAFWQGMINIYLFFQSRLSRELVMIPFQPVYSRFGVDFVTVLEAILTRRQPREKLQCLYENL